MVTKRKISLGLTLLLIGFVDVCSTEVIRKKVAILGGGMAGVMAARTLSENGISDFLIIEAEPVLGGRLKETKFGGYTIELGANWIEGIRNNQTEQENPIWTLAQKYKLQNIYSDFDNILTYDQNGWFNYTDVIDRAFTRVDQVGEDAEKREALDLEDLSFAQGLSLREWFPQTPYEKVAEWWAFDFGAADTPSASSMIYTAIVDKATFGDWSDESYLVIDQRGYATLVREEAKTFANSENILYNSAATVVTYSNNSVNITLKNGSIIWADYAICTFSLGVLQHNDVKFVPQFPIWKQEAIFKFKMTTYTKIFLQFSYKFWNDTQFFLYADPHHRGYYPHWQSLSEIGFFPGSNIIFVTVVTDQAYIVESQNNNQTLMEIMTVLRSMYGQTVPQPTDYYYYRWTHDPLYRGSYSVWPVGTSRCQHDNLRRPIGRLHFTGEVYSPKYYGFVQGAYVEGLQTGKKIADYILGEAYEPNIGNYVCTRNSSATRIFKLNVFSIILFFLWLKN